MQRQPGVLPTFCTSSEAIELGKMDDLSDFVELAHIIKYVCLLFVSFDNFYLDKITEK